MLSFLKNTSFMKSSLSVGYFLPLVFLTVLFACQSSEQPNRMSSDSMGTGRQVVVSDYKCDVSQVEVGIERQLEVDSFRLVRCVRDSFLITADAVGYFGLDDTIGALPRWYGFGEEESPEAKYYDGGAMGGRVLSNLAGGYMTIVYKMVEDTTVCAGSDRYLYVESPNNTGYYVRDSIGYIELHDSSFKTKEGIGVNSSFADLRKNYSDIEFYYNDANIEGFEDVRISVKELPYTVFRFSEEDLTEQGKKEGAHDYRPEDGSSIKPDAKILWIDHGPIVGCR